MSAEIIFLHEYASFRLLTHHSNEEKKTFSIFTKQINNNTLKMLYKTLRRVLWFYSKSFETIAIVGIEFVQKEKKIIICLVANDNSKVEIVNPFLEKAIEPIFRVLKKKNTLFVHWNDIEKQERLLNEKET